jgi:hypothetical protein
LLKNRKSLLKAKRDSLKKRRSRTSGYYLNPQIAVFGV